MQNEEITIKDIDKALLEEEYVSNKEISTTLFLSFLLGKPMLIEGPPGVGKTELAKVVAKTFDRDFFRIQCYEGITFEQIVGEWNYQKQLLHLEAAKNAESKEDTIFEEEYFIRRSLLNAFLNEKDSVLLIDEIDKADEEVESFLLQALGEQEITINDLGTFQLQNDLIVILTSNSQRSLLDETKDRCLFLYIPYPSVEREIEIVKSKLPEADEETVSTVVKIVHEIRNLNLLKKPSVRGTVDWVKSVSSLGNRNTADAMKERVLYLDIIRIIACIMIIAMHAPIPNTGLSSYVLSTDSLLTALGIGLFIMVSGALLLPVNMPTEQFLKKRFAKIVFPTVLWTLFYYMIAPYTDTVTHPFIFHDCSLTPIYFERKEAARYPAASALMNHYSFR